MNKEIKIKERQTGEEPVHKSGIKGKSQVDQSGIKRLKFEF